MPPPPPFDYYAELQVESSASLAEINYAYRRLARIHHPDKNPDHQEEATTTFQRLQLAHETLSDPDKRERYDNADLWDDEDDPYGTAPFPFPFFFELFVASRLFRGQPRRGFSQAQEAFENSQAERESRRHESNRRQEEARIRREEEQRQRQEAKEARRQAAERSEALAKRHLRDKELMKQERRWKEMGAVSKDERVLTCLHSELCDKVKHTKKFKCTACSSKRGMIAFECPHCSAFLCQLCVTDFSERRKKLDTQEQMKEPETSKDYAGASGKPTDNKPDADKPTGKLTTKKPKNKKSKSDKSAKQTSEEPPSVNNGNGNKENLGRDPGLSEAGEDKAAPASGGQFASDNPYNILAGDGKATSPPFEKSASGARFTSQPITPFSTVHPHGTGGDNEKPASVKPLPLKKKKRQDKKVANNNSAKGNLNLHIQDQQTKIVTAVKPNTTGVIHHNHRQTLPSDSSELLCQNMAAQSASNNIKNDPKAPVSTKPQESKHHGAPFLQEKPKGPGRSSTAGATGGYIRALNSAYSLTMANLRQAMEKFGAVRSLRITNKRSGTAHVDFVAHDGLRLAIAASPVVVSEKVTVRVVELRYCDICGKAGHVARICRAANSPG